MADRRRSATSRRSRPADFPSSRHATRAVSAKEAARRGRRRARRRARSAGARPMTRVERRGVQERRRTRTIVIGSALLAVAVLVAWFPGGSLLEQHAALAATNSQLQTLRRQDAALAQEQKNLNTPSEIERIARQQYNLVLPGQAAFQVLPPNGSATGTNAPYPGDPGLSSPVVPSGTPELPPGGVHVDSTGGPSRLTGVARHAAAPATQGGGVLGRIIRTLEFWR